MRYGRRLRRFSGRLGLRRRSPLLEYGRYSRLGRYRRFYSEEEVLNDPELVGLLEEIEAETEKLPEAVEDAIKEAEEIQKEAPEAFEEALEEIEAAAEGRVNSRTFSKMARLRIYNMTAEEFEDAEQKAVEIVGEAADILSSSDIDDVEVKAEGGGLVSRIINSIVENIKAGFRKLRNFIYEILAAIVATDLKYFPKHIVLTKFTAATVLFGLAALFTYLVPLVIKFSGYLAGTLTALTQLGFVFVAFVIGLSLFMLMSKIESDLKAQEKRKALQDAAVALNEAAPLVKDAKERGLSSVDPKKAADFVKRHRDLIQTMKKMASKR